jgi:hypothetical protein
MIGKKRLAPEQQYQPNGKPVKVRKQQSHVAGNNVLLSLTNYNRGFPYNCGMEGSNLAKIGGIWPP